MNQITTLKINKVKKSNPLHSMGNEGAAGSAALATTCSTCCTSLIGIAYTVVMIIAVVQSSQDSTMLDTVSAANTYYIILPIISIVIPNPITTGMIAFTDCSEFNNCDESYRSLYTAGFSLCLVVWALVSLLCFVFCCGACCLGCGLAGMDKKTAANIVSES